jgi:conjugative relaxase-like TrwC/TraI family protein
VKFTITPLGGARSALPKIVEGIVRYLQPPPQPVPGPPASGPQLGVEGPSRYYADSGEEPGRWLGHVANASGLTGAVDAGDFASVLAGRDPRTGERLITAQGSAGRRKDLGAGKHTRLDPTGIALYGEADAATVLGVTKAEAARMLDVGTMAALSRVVPVLGSVTGSYLVPVIEPDGSRWVTEGELSRCEASREAGVDPEELAATGTPGDQFPLAEAARLAGTTARYLRTLVSRYDKDRDRIDASIAAGRRPRQAYLVAHRGTRGQWLVTRQYLTEYLQRRRPPAVRVGYDLTLTTEKSLSVLALLAEPTVGRVVLDAIQTSNDHAIGWLEQRAALARVGGAQVHAAGWTVASFRHLTSRALDPFAHHHNVVANTVLLPDGTRRALDARGLYQHAHAASALATAEMRRQLSQQLGVRWSRGRNGSWEIAGIPDGVLREFSRRRNEIDDALVELEEAIGRGAHPGEVEHIVLATRPAKNHTPAATLIDAWRDRAAGHGFTPERLDACLNRSPVIGNTSTDALFTSLAGPDGICAGGSVFTRADALAALVNHPVPPADPGDEPQPLLVGAARLEELTDLFLRSRHAVPLGDLDDGLYSTVEILDVQHRIIDRFRRGLHRGAHLASAAGVGAALDGHPHLTDEQRSLARAWCQSGHRFQAAIGRAGAGKTTTVAACADAWAAAGWRVLGAAVKGEAARTLAAATGIECETVAWYLAHPDPERLPLDHRTILVIDEASTIADRDLDALMTMATRTGASLRLIGDPAQHGAIAAGGMFRVVCQHHPADTPELTESHRLQHPQDRAAADALRAGRVDDALDHLAAAGHLHIVDDDLTLYRHVLARWWDAHQAGLDHPMVDRRNSTRRTLNRLAHQLLSVHGDLGGDEIEATGDRRFAVGDRVTARAPNRGLHPPAESHAYVRNGALGTITAIHRAADTTRDAITVAFDGIGTIDVPRSFFDHHRTTSGRPEVGIDHAYALTSYAVQGSTRELSTSRIDATATRAETYVDITRGRTANHLYMTATSDTLDGEHLPRLPAPDVDAAVAHRLKHSTGELTAWELAQHQHEVGQAVRL